MFLRPALFRRPLSTYSARSTGLLRGGGGVGSFAGGGGGAGRAGVCFNPFFICWGRRDAGNAGVLPPKHLDVQSVMREMLGMLLVVLLVMLVAGDAGREEGAFI